MRAALRHHLPGAPFKTTVLIRARAASARSSWRGPSTTARPRGEALRRRQLRGHPREPLESELFGHKKGAFTDANADKRGLFEEADGGTLFLDEIGELPLALQVKLLRVLQESTSARLGETTTARSRCAWWPPRTATSSESEGGRFREDLFYRLNVLSLTIPPLRERREDIPLLVDHFLARFNERSAPASGRLPRRAAAPLRVPWPGNVRELEHAIERAMVLADSTVLAPGPRPRIREPATPSPPSSTRAALHQEDRRA
jgi:two-component system response regulator AtoC